MSVVIDFTSPGNPPNNITSFQIERSVRAASGTIAAAGDVNNVTKVVTVTFDGTPPADNALLGDQMEIGGLLYNIIANTSTTITFSPTTDLSTITTFPTTFVVLNDLAEFSTFETVGTVTPDVPFTDNVVHQYTDSTGTIYDFYQIKTVDSGGTVSADPLTDPFRPGQVVNLAVDEKRLTPKDQLAGIIGGSLSFEVTVIIGGRRQDPKDNRVVADVFTPPHISPNGRMTAIAELEMTRVGLGQYRTTWTIPTEAPQAVGGFTLYPDDQYIVAYKGNFTGLIGGAPDNFREFDSELFSLRFLDGPIHGRFPANATLEDLRQTFFEIDAYLPEALSEKTDVEARNKVLQYHLERASDKLNEELNMHQIRGNSQDRREYVTSRAVYTILMAARGQNSSAISDKMLEFWRDRAEYVLAQLKREGIAQGFPLGRG